MHKQNECETDFQVRPLEVDVGVVVVKKSQIQVFKDKLSESILRRSKCVRDWPDDPSYKQLLIDLTQVKDQQAFTDFEKSIENLSDRSIIFKTFKDQIYVSYEEMDMDTALKRSFPTGVPMISAFETIGHIAHLNLSKEHEPFKHNIAKIILDKNSALKTVISKKEALSSEFRTMDFELLGGLDQYKVNLKENGLAFEFDFRNVYWSARLAQERLRLTGNFCGSDILLDVTAGVGGFGLYAMKQKGCESYNNDLNPFACEYMKRNAKLNKIDETQFHVYNLDGHDFLQSMSEIFSHEVAPKKRRRQLLTQQDPINTKQVFHVTVNLPHLSIEFIQSVHKFSQCLSSTSEVRAHIYFFCDAKDGDLGDFKFVKARAEELLGFSPNLITEESRVVRSVSPGTVYCHVCFLFFGEEAKVQYLIEKDVSGDD